MNGMIGSMKARLALAPLLAATALWLPLNGGFAQVKTPAIMSPGDSWSYADIADLFGAAPIAARVRIASIAGLEAAASAGRPAGTTRFFVEADVLGLIRGSGGLPPRVRYLADVAPDSRGKLPKLKRAEMLVAAFPVSGRPAEIRLAARDAQAPWSAALEARVRTVLASMAAPGAPPPVTGITSAFHVAGSIPGEGETQIFLATATAMPVSLTVLRRPGEQPRWAVALGEIVDEAAEPPARDTLAWYRLACFLPRDLPAEAIEQLAPADADAARTDYGFVLDSLGSCTRTRG